MRDPVPFWPRDPGLVKNRIRIRDTDTDHISESFGLKHKLFYADPGSGMEKIRIRDTSYGMEKIQIRDPG